MALTARPTLVVTIDYIDGSGSRGQSVTHLPAGTLLATAITKVDALVALIQAVTTCGIVGYSISTGKTEVATPSTDAKSRVEHKAELTFRTAAAKKAHFSVPSPDPATVAASGGIISTPAGVAALIAALGGGANFCDSNGSFLTAQVADAEIFNRTTMRQLTTDTNPAT
jgi:hypothetical protein